MKENGASRRPEQKSDRKMPEIVIDSTYPPQLFTVSVNKEHLASLIDAFGYTSKGPNKIIFRGDFWIRSGNLLAPMDQIPSDAHNLEGFISSIRQKPNIGEYFQKGFYDSLTKNVVINLDTIAIWSILDWTGEKNLALKHTKKDLANALVHELHHALDPKTVWSRENTKIFLPPAFCTAFAALTIARLRLDNPTLTTLSAVSLAGLTGALIHLRNHIANYKHYTDSPNEQKARKAGKNEYLLRIAADTVNIQETSLFEKATLLTRKYSLMR